MFNDTQTAANAAKHTRKIPLSDGTIISAGIYENEGENLPWIMFSNSVLTSAAIWRNQVTKLRKFFRIVTYDQRGHGHSSVPSGALDFAQYGADVIAVLDACSIEHCRFIGLSMGVPSGLAAFAIDPARFVQFVAVDGIAKSSAERKQFWANRRAMANLQGMQHLAAQVVPAWLPDEPTNSPLCQSLMQMLEQTPAQGFVAATQALASYDLSNVLSQLNIPFLVITGEKDTAIRKLARAQFSAVPQVRFADIQGAGHLPNFQKPQAFNEILLGFLDVTSNSSHLENN